MLRLRWGLALGVFGFAAVAALELSASSCSSDSFAPPPPAAFCAAHPNATGMFCDDFEKLSPDGGAFDPAWTLTLTGGGTATREASGTGFAFHSVVPGTAGKRAAELEWDPNIALARHIGMRAKVKLSAECAGGQSLFVLSGFAANAVAGIGLGVATDTTSKKTPFVLYAGSQAADAGPKLASWSAADDAVFGAWLDITMDVTFDRPRDAAPAGGVDLVVTVGGTKVIEVLGGEGGAAIAFPKLAIGATTTTSPVACDAWMDDVVLEVTK